MNPVIRFLKKHLVGLGLTVGSLLVISALHFLHAFDFLEFKAIDLAFRIRGPISGWAARDEIPKDSLNVVIVDIDDESYRLVPWTWPYPRHVWAMVVENLSLAGAKVIVFDIQFDSPDRQSEYLKEIRGPLRERGMDDLLPAHGDSAFADAIRQVQARGTSVVLGTKLLQEPTRIPPQYVQYPIDVLQTANPSFGLVNENPDLDGVSRQYFTFLSATHDPGRWYPTLGMKAVQKYLDLPDETLPSVDHAKNVVNYGPLTIPISGRGERFLVNYYGPASGVKLGEGEAWKTFNRYPLSNVVDIGNVELRDPDEDIDWMSQFLPGEVPAWVEEIDDPDTRAELMVQLGLGDEFNIETSPFYNKIVLIGVSVEVLHDVKRTPFYSFAGQQQFTPGVEFHANAIQTLLDRNFVSLFGNRVTWAGESWKSHLSLIAGLSLLAFLFLTFMNPLFAGLSILLEILVFISIAVGQFTADSWWLFKGIIHNILPTSWLQKLGEWVIINTPGFGESMIIPIVASVTGVFLTYGSNVLYRFIMEQKDKRFLKNTFGTYVSPELIDQMYDTKQEPKLGGDAGYHTAFFSDIQSFSSFSEVLEPVKMVSLMNEYLTEMTEILLARQGTLDKYIGDAIVAFYGAPMPVDDHEYQACKTALDMEGKLATLRERWSKDNEWPELVHHMRHRVGLNSGEMVTGNMGSNMRMNYTMMGDTVNLAARLEASAKQYGVYIQVAENTYKSVKDQFEWRFLDYVRVKGKKHPVRVYELLAEKGQLNETLEKMLPFFLEGLEFYNAQKWDKAIKVFRASEELEDIFPMRPTNPSRVYLQRCEILKENPPDEDWDGVWTLTQK